MLTRGKTKKSGCHIEIQTEEDTDQAKLTSELTEVEAGEEWSVPRSREKRQEKKKMSDLETVLREIREFRQENAENLREICAEIRTANSRIDEAERRIGGQKTEFNV